MCYIQFASVHGPGAQTPLSRASAGSERLRSRCHVGYVPVGGPGSLSKLLRSLAEFNCICRIKVPTLLLAVSQGSLSAPRGQPRVLSVWSSPGSSPNTAADVFRARRRTSLTSRPSLNKARLRNQAHSGPSPF